MIEPAQQSFDHVVRRNTVARQTRLPSRRHVLYAPDVKATDPDGKPCKITDLKAGQKIEVTTKDGDSTIAIQVACVT